MPLFTMICRSQEVGQLSDKLLYEEMKKERSLTWQAITAMIAEAF
jgi:hypothetical protein